MMGEGMKNFRYAFLGLLALALLALPPSLTMAAPSAPPLQAPAKSPLPLPIAEQLGQQLQSLVATPPASGGEGDEANQEPSPTFGTRALGVVITVTEILQAE